MGSATVSAGAPASRGCRRPQRAHGVGAGRGFQGSEDREEFLVFVNLAELGHHLEALLAEPHPQQRFDAGVQSVTAPETLNTRDVGLTSLHLNAVQLRAHSLWAVGGLQ